MRSSEGLEKQDGTRHRVTERSVGSRGCSGGIRRERTGGASMADAPPWARVIRVYGTPSSKMMYPAYQPEATAPVPRTVASTGRLSLRIATASAMNSGNTGIR